MAYYTGPVFNQIDSNINDRKECYQAASKFISELSSISIQFIYSMYDRMDYVYSNNQLNNLEESLFGDVITNGTFPKRNRFWKFCLYNLKGIIPKDIK